MHQSELDFTNNLRQASPYIAKHRNKTIVIYLPGELIFNSEALQQLAKDIVLLNNLGLKVVLTLGASLQINQAFEALDIPWQTQNDTRITTLEHLEVFQKTIGVVRAQVEAAFSKASAEQNIHLTIVSGNWVIAQPKGIINGIDFQHTGILRKINNQAIENTLNAGQVALLTPLAYSLTGEVFNLNTLEQAFAIATKLDADKLLIFTDQGILRELPQALSRKDVKNHLETTQSDSQKRLLKLATEANEHIRRIHLMSQENPSAMLLELFSRDGHGTLIYNDRYHELRPAQSDDVAGIINLITPLEQEGILTKRSREALELEIHNFVVIEIDQKIIGCAALYPIDTQNAELACLAVDKNYQGLALGEELLNGIQKKARDNHISTLYLLTTHTHHWFIEHGFTESSPSHLPESRQSFYNNQRQSKVLLKKL